MSHSIRAISNKNQRQSKVYFRQYLSNIDEPDDASYPGAASGNRMRPLEHEQSDGYYMVVRRQIKQDAQKLRTDYL